ncbi:MAG: hypothetical protein U0835_15265 [Isosphaeraceae bacterium]
MWFPAGTPPWSAEQSQGLISPEAPFSLPLHPTQLYSAVDGLILLRAAVGVTRCGSGTARSCCC